MAKLNAQIEAAYGNVIEMTFAPANAAPANAPYILAANDHQGITEAFGMTAAMPQEPQATFTFPIASNG